MENRLVVRGGWGVVGEGAWVVQRAVAVTQPSHAHPCPHAHACAQPACCFAFQGVTVQLSFKQQASGNIFKVGNF